MKLINELTLCFEVSGYEKEIRELIKENFKGFMMKLDFK
jgi:putative aminopeptidase FrvX